MLLMDFPAPPGVTELLQAWNDGDRDALPRLVPLVYQELKALAYHQLAARRGTPTLQATALVHEAYLRLAGKSGVQWNSRVHFFAVMAHMLRGILVDHARAHYAVKRGAGALTLALDDAMSLAGQKELDLVALNEALEQLSELDPQQGKIVELRFFGGLSIAETAEVLGVSPATVKRDWTLAKTWIRRAIGEGRE